MQHGFLVEIRDRYPQGARRPNGQPCAGQNRYRLVLLDPAEGTVVDLEDAIIESTIPIDVSNESPDQLGTRKSRAATPSARDIQERSAKPQISWARDYQERNSAVLDNQDPFIGREEGLVRLG